jgi:hypothetical protein
VPEYLSPFLAERATVEADPRIGAHLDRQGLLSLWARSRLGDIPPEDDSPLATFVRRRRRETAAHHALLRARVDPLLEAFAREGATVVLKGMVLAESLYPSLSDRPMADVDVWCPGSTAERALRIALERGWAVDRLYADVPPGSFGWRPQLNLISPEGDAPLDLHRLLVPAGRYRFPPGFLLDRASALPFLPAGVVAPDPRDHILFLAVHAAGHHGWEGLAKGWEIGAIWERLGEGERREVVEAARRAGCLRPLALSLELSRRHLGFRFELPPLDRRGLFWASAVERALARDLRGLPVANRWEELLTTLLQADALAANLRYLVGQVVRRRR